jgi:ubiquinone/menaquinone biosynthesis C-methylase UbiE
MNRRVSMRAVVTCTIITLGIVSTASCQEMGGPDAWEVRYNAFQPPDSVMDAIGVEAGWVIAEVGAGRGRYAVHMALRVGKTGRVYANDIDEEALEYLEFRCRRDSIPNVITILGEVTDPKLPSGALDMVYLINTYHHLEEPVELMKNILPSLKPTGILVIIEHDPDKFPDAHGEWTPREVLVEQAGEAGFELVRIETFLRRDNINIFRPGEITEQRGEAD